MKAAVDVHDLTGDRARVVRQQEADRVGDRRRILDVPAERRLRAPQLRELSKPGIPRAATVPSGPAETRFTRIPRGPRSRARYRDTDSSAAFATPIQS